jgi:hypothetical protein
MEEVRNGECKGPYTEAELDAIFPAGWLAAKRFAVLQKQKVAESSTLPPQAPAEKLKVMPRFFSLTLVLWSCPV